MAPSGKRTWRLRAKALAVAAVTCATLVGAPKAATAQATTAAGAQLPDLGQAPDPAVLRAVTLLGGAFGPLPRIYVVDPARLKVKTTAAAFRLWYQDRVNPNVFVNRRSELYQQAFGGDACALKSMAALLAHEFTHSGGKDEAEPSRVETGVLDRFIANSTIGMREQVCLMVRREAVQLYARAHVAPVVAERRYPRPKA